MDTNDFPVATILEVSRRFIAPFYKQNCRWDKALPDRFWDDADGTASK